MLNRIQNRLRRLHEAGLHRRLRTVEGPQGPRIVLEGREVVNFASNDYLGLANHPAVVRAMRGAAERWGAGAGASRLVAGNTALHEELERRIAQFEGREAAIVFNSGYAANVGTISALLGRGDLALGDRLNHASIVDGCRLSGAKFVRYKHADVSDLERHLAKAHKVGEGEALVLTDGVFSVDGDIAPLGEIAGICGRRGAWLMVDEAHATGVLGERGRGASEACGAETAVQVLMGTLSKAVGAMGGYVAGSADLMDYLRNAARGFIYTTALPPAVCAAAIAGLDIVQNEPERRHRLAVLAGRLRRGLAERGWDSGASATQIVPVMAGSEEAALGLSERLMAAGFFAPALRPPTVPAGRCRLRVSVTSEHEVEDIERFLEALGTPAPDSRAAGQIDSKPRF